MNSLIKRKPSLQPHQIPAATESTWAVQQYDEDHDSISLRHYLSAFGRRKWLIVGTVLVVVATALAQVLTTTPLYTATALLQVDPEPDKIVPYEEIFEITLPSRSEAYLWTQVEKLQIRSLALRVIEQLELLKNEGFTAPVGRGVFIDQFRKLASAMRILLRGKGDETLDKNRAIDKLLGNIDARQVRETRLIAVVYTSAEPQLAAKVLAAVAEEFIKAHQEGRNESAIQATEFLKTKLQELQAAVSKSEESLIEYARIHGIQDARDQENIHLQKLADLTEEMTRRESALAQKKVLYEMAMVADQQNFPAALKNDTTRELENRIAELQQSYSRLSAQHGEQWPDVQALVLELAELESQLVSSREQAIREARADYQFSVDGYQALASAQLKQQEVVDRQKERSVNYLIMKRDADSNKTLYEGLLQRFKEAEVLAALHSTKIHIVEMPTVPGSPTTPKKRRALVLAVILGSFLGCCLALVAEALDDSIKTNDDIVQYLGLPSLGFVPTLARTEDRWRLHLRRRKNEQDIVTLIDVDTQNWAWEPYRSIRTSIWLSHPERSPRSLLVTSALPGDGKTTFAANIAIVLSRAGARTLMLDLDMRKPTLSEKFKVSGPTGISTFLTGDSGLSSQIQQIEGGNLFIIPAGPIPPDPPELMASRRMSDVLTLLKAHFTYIVIDTPPSLALSDALTLAPEVDGVFLVVRSGKTHRDAARATAERIAGVGAALLGAVLNDVDIKRSLHTFHGTSGFAPKAEEDLHELRHQVRETESHMFGSAGAIPNST